MGSYKDTLWRRLEPLAGELGLGIFDIETPGGGDAPSQHGFLRVFITKSGGGSDLKPLTVDISDCAKFSKVILNLPDVEELIPGECQLEVSSPGINRKLSRADHFAQAVGERLRLVVTSESQPKKEVLRGKLLAFDGQSLEIEEEVKKARQRIDYKNVAEARVDFNFN